MAPQKTYWLTYRLRFGFVARTKAFRSWKARAAFIVRKHVTVIEWWEV